MLIRATQALQLGELLSPHR